MNLKKIDGKIDTRTLALDLYTHMANEIHSHNRTTPRETDEFKNQMVTYIKVHLDELTKEIGKYGL